MKFLYVQDPQGWHEDPAMLSRPETPRAAFSPTLIEEKAGWVERSSSGHAYCFFLSQFWSLMICAISALGAKSAGKIFHRVR